MPPSSAFPRGATPTPRHKLLYAKPYRLVTAPTQIAYVPAKLDMWGNDTYGDCVTAESAFALACYQPEIFIDTSVVVAWAKKNGFLNGADLGTVLDAMASNGFVVGGQQYDEGTKFGVDYSNESILQSAISQGPVKIAIDANALPSGAGSEQGWEVTGGGKFGNTDHCVSLAGFGPVSYLYTQLSRPLPTVFVTTPNLPGYLLYTWATEGFVDYRWLMNTCTEAWVRNPTTVGVPPLPGPPPVVIDWSDA